MNSVLPVRALNVCNADELCTAHGVKVSLNVRHRPRLADGVVERATVVHAETRLAVLARDDADVGTPRTRKLFDGVVIEHIFDSLIDNGFSAAVGAVWVATNGFGVPIE